MKEPKSNFLVYVSTFNHLDENIQGVNVFNRDNELIIGFEKK